MSKKPTCGQLYKAGLDRYAGSDPEQIRMFAAGFVTGQAEKVYLGVCLAAMFRPSAERRSMLLRVIRDVAKRYGLMVFTDTKETGEIWLHRPGGDALFELRRLYRMQPDTHWWHAIRAALCGIPRSHLDEKYHEREGHGERCD